MNSFFCTLLLVSQILSGLAYPGKWANSQNSGYLQRCREPYCTSSRGHFDESDFYRDYYGYYAKQIYSARPRDFVAHVSFEPGYENGDDLFVCPGWRSCSPVTHNQVIRHPDVSFLRFLLRPNSRARVTIRYFVGCRVIEGSNIEFEYASSNNLDHICWVLIPRLYSTARNQYVAATNVFIKDANLATGENVHLYDILSDSVLLNVTESTELDARTVPKSITGAAYNRVHLSTLLYMEVSSSSGGQRSLGSGFAVKTIEMSKRDSNCVQEREACEFGLEVGEGRRYDCANKRYRRCSAFDRILAEFPAGAEREIPEDEKESITMRDKKISLGSSGKGCVNHYKGKEYIMFCLSRPSCSRYRQCMVYCLLYRMCSKNCAKPQIANFLP